MTTGPCCPVCFEDFEESGAQQPLLLACCRACSVCRACIERQLACGTNKCFYCPQRPNSRLFVDKCIAATPADHLACLCRAEAESESAAATGPAQSQGPKLSSGILAEELLALSEVPGDSQLAKQLQAQMEEEENDRRRQAEKSDYLLAQRLSLESRAPLMPLPQTQKREREKLSGGGDIRQMFQKQEFLAKKRVVVVDLSLDDDDDDEEEEGEGKL